MSESKKRQKKSGKHPSKEPSELGKEAGANPIRRKPVLLVAVIACAAVAVVLVLVLLPKAPQGPDVRDGADVHAPEPSVQGSTDIALRDEAFDVVRRLMEDFPGNVNAIGLMGTVYNAFGNTTQAETWWRKCLELDPTRVDVYNVLAVAFLRKGEYEKVAELVRMAQTVDPNFPHVYRCYAEALLEMGELDEALEAMEKEMRITPGLSETHITLGKIYLQREEYDKAARAYTRAIELRPKSSRSYYGLATASARLGQRDKAKKYMETFAELRAQEDAPSMRQRRSVEKPRQAAGILAEVLVDAGREYSGHQQFLKAEEYWRRAATRDPTNTPSREELVRLYMRTRRGKEALEVCEQLRTIDPKNAHYHRITGIVLTQLGQFDAAEEAIRQTIELAPTARHYYLLGEVRSQNQDHSGALAAMKQAAELDPDNEQIREAYKRLQERQ